MPEDCNKTEDRTKPHRKWAWSVRKEQAALDVAQDKLTDVQIAERACVSKRSFEDWKKIPEFAERVKEHRAAIRERICSTGYASIERRVQKLTELLDKYDAIVAARAREYATSIPGGETGLVVKTYRTVGRGRNAKVVEEYVFDRALSAEIRETLDDIASEVGGRVRKTDVTSGGEPFKVYLTAEVDAV